MPVPIDGERAGRYSSSARSNPVSQHDFSIEEIEDIIRFHDAGHDSLGTDHQR